MFAAALRRATLSVLAAARLAGLAAVVYAATLPADGELWAQSSPPAGSGLGASSAPSRPTGSQNPFQPTPEPAPAVQPAPELPLRSGPAAPDADADGGGEGEGAAEGIVDGIDREDVADVVGQQLYINALQYGFNRSGTEQVLDGEVIAIGAGVVITADHLRYSVPDKVEASGHIVMMSRDVVFLGETVTYDLKTTNFVITKATMVANDPREVEKVTQRVLGFSAKEIEFERARTNRLKEVSERLQRLRDEARRQARAGQPLNEDLVQRYARLLDQQDLIASQQNPTLGRLPEERRALYERRRQYWEKNRKASVPMASATLEKAYFKITGDTIERSDGNDFVSREAMFTPCLCEEDEAPAWGFRADQIDAQIGGYADLHHPVLEIKGIPVLYLPYLKLPLKDERQSGFLPPTFSFDDASGNIFSQPVFFDLGKDADATLTTDVFENRGTRLGVEYRFQQREFSGWELKLEGMRDRLWMADRGVREELGPLYKEGLAAARAGTGEGPTEGDTDYDTLKKTLTTEAYWEKYWDETYRRKGQLANPATREASYDKLDRSIDVAFAEPTNTWRGAAGWRGVTFFAPRLSLVSNADITSDHRYNEDLYVPSDFQDALDGGRDVRALSAAKAQVNLDGKDLYIGVGARYGDNYQLDERFEGQQMPTTLKVQSRKYPLFPESTPVPVYAQVQGENVRITETPSKLGAELAGPSLGDGNWRRVKVDTVSPLLRQSIVQVSHFAEGEARYVEASSLPSRSSEIRSWRTGIEITLPIDGKGELPAALAVEDDPACIEGGLDYDARRCEDIKADPDRPRKYVHHLMTWGTRFSVRPTVVKNGPYTDPQLAAEDGLGLAYFASDNSKPLDSPTDRDVPDEARMRAHQRITLWTDHRWRLLRRDWRRVKAEARPAPAAAGVSGAASPAAAEGAGPGEEAAAVVTAPPAYAPPADAPSREEQARRELLSGLDKTVSSEQDLYDEMSKRWLIDRYQLTDDYYADPVTFNAQIAYDFLDAKERERQRAEDREAGRTDRIPIAAWKPPEFDLGVSYAGFGLGVHVIYDIYLRTSTDQAMTLALPAVLSTNLELGYRLTKSYKRDDGDTVILPTRTRSASVVTTIIPAVQAFASVARQAVEGQTYSHTAHVQSAIGFRYDSPADCWGLQFVRRKKYEEQESQADYVLQLLVLFMGQQRELPNMSAAAVREARGGETEEEE